MSNAQKIQLPQNPVSSAPATETPPLVESVSPESLGADLVKELPPVSENAIAALAAESTSGAKPAAPAAPAAPAPEPGKRKRGRPPGSKTKPAPGSKSEIGPDPIAPEIPAPENPTTAGPDRAAVLADCYVRAFYSGADAIFSGRGEWLPENEAEHLALRDSLAAYLRATNAEDLPPGWALALSALTYAAARVQKPRTLSTLQKWGLWFRSRWASWRTARRLSDLPAA